MTDQTTPTDDNDVAPKYEETDTPGVYITSEVPLISSVPDTDDGIAYEDMTPEQKVEYGFVPCSDFWHQIPKPDDDEE